MEKFFDKRKDFVLRFIKSYLTQKQLSQVPSFDENEDMHTDEAIHLVPVNSFDSALEEGQIRLLSQTERITYVALLRRWENNSFVVMPFSSYNTPATDEEFLTEYDGGLFQRVLQVWNTRTLQDASLRKSWLVGSLSQGDLDDAWKFWEASLGGAAVEDRLLEKTALPIYHADDPRLEYKQMELKNFARLDAEDLAWLDIYPALDLKGWRSTQQPELALAAGKAPENILVEFRPEGIKAVVSFVYSPTESTAHVEVFDEEGNESTMLDGYTVVNTADGSPLAKIENGFCQCPCPESVDGLALQDKNGNILSGTSIAK